MRGADLALAVDQERGGQSENAAPGVGDGVVVARDFCLELVLEEGANGVLVPRAVVGVELHKMAGRVLTYMVPGRRLPGSFWFKDEVVDLEGEYEPEDLIGRPGDIALDLSMTLFNRAGWEAPRTLISEDQNRYAASRR